MIQVNLSHDKQGTDSSHVMSANKRYFSSQQLIYQGWALLCTEIISNIIALKQGKARQGKVKQNI
jgi:hypothetical protein